LRVLTAQFGNTPVAVLGAAAINFDFGTLAVPVDEGEAAENMGPRGPVNAQ